MALTKEEIAAMKTESMSADRMKSKPSGKLRLKVAVTPRAMSGSSEALATKVTMPSSTAKVLRAVTEILLASGINREPMMGTATAIFSIVTRSIVYPVFSAPKNGFREVRYPVLN